MKDTIKDMAKYSIMIFMVTNTIMIWLQGGGRYIDNSGVNYKLCLMVSIPVTILAVVIPILKSIKK